MSEEEIKTEVKQFVHLHVHDEFSLLDGFSKVEDYANEVKKRGWKYLAITNHGMMGQIPRQYKICKALGITPLYGCEIYVNDNTEYRSFMTKDGETQPLPEKFSSLDELREQFKKNYHVVLIAKNEIGFKNLLKITSHAWIEGYYRRPRTNHKFIQEHSEGLICGSACMAGPVASFILKDDMEKAYAAAEYYQSMFGEDFYLEIMFLEMEEQFKINKGLLQIGKELGIDLVLTNDCHYLEKDDSYYQDILLLMQNGNTLNDLDNPSKDVFQFGSKNLWYKTIEELDESWRTNHSYIPKDVYEQMKTNTVKFAEKCNVTIDTTLKIPEFDKYSKDVPDEFKKSSDDYLRYLGYQGLKKRKLNEKKEYLDRIEVELDVIKKKQFSSYFLIVNDLIEFAKRSKISVGPGRGSAAGSLLCYCLEITDVDPIVHNLFFERFLNEARKDIPDIDIDFAPAGRDSIKQHIIDTYGQKHVCSIGTYGSFQTKATVTDVCRVFNIELEQVKALTKQMLSDVDEFEWDEIRNDPAYKEGFDKIDTYRRTVRDKIVSPLEAIGKIRFKQKNASSHAAGVIISNVDLTENLPLMTRDDTVLSSWIEGKKGTELSAFGFVKWDILGLANLTFIENTLDLIKERFGKVVTVEQIDSNLNDPKIYEELKKGKGGLIFQFESPLMRKLLKDSQCDNFDVLAAITALGRPGPLQSGLTDEFCKRKIEHDKLKAEGRPVSERSYKINPVLEKILNYTYGIVVYQEQIMQIANVLAGYSLAETDNFRKVLIKVKKDTKDDMWDKLMKYKEKFIEGGQKYMKVEELEELFDGFLKWAGYGFNRSHAVAYTVISYRCAWLKTYYPTEYVCSVLRYISKGETKSKGKSVNKYESYIFEAKRFNILTEPPDINKSGANFEVEDSKTIRMGLYCLKGVGIEQAQKLIDHRPAEGFKTFEELLKQKPAKRIMIPLIIIGAFDCLCGRIEALVKYYHTRGDKIDEECKKFRKEIEDSEAKDYGYIDSYKKLIKSLIEITENFSIPAKKLELEKIDFTKYELTKDEKEGFFKQEFGFGFNHPFDKFIQEKNLNVEMYDSIAEVHDEYKGITVGCINEIQKRESVSGREFRSVYMTDGYGSENTLKFQIFNAKFDSMLEKGKVVVAKFNKNIDIRNLRRNIDVEWIKDPFDPELSIENITALKTKEAEIVKISEILLKKYETDHEGERPVSFVDLNKMKVGELASVVGIIKKVKKNEKGNRITIAITDSTFQIDLSSWKKSKDERTSDLDEKLKIDDCVCFTVKIEEYIPKEKKKKVEVVEEKPEEPPKPIVPKRVYEIQSYKKYKKTIIDGLVEEYDKENPKKEIIMKTKKEFVHLHLHSKYSFDSMSDLELLVLRAKDLGQKSIALTDHEICHGHYNFHRFCNEAKISSILGCEVNIVSDKTSKDNVHSHLILLPKNKEGLDNIYKIVTDSVINGFHRTPRTDYKFLKENKGNLIILSSCLESPIAQAILEDDEEYALQYADRFKQLFGNDFYLEIQPNELQTQKDVNKKLIEIGKKQGIKFVATNDCHYLFSSDEDKHTKFLELNGLKENRGELYLKEYDDMVESFKKNDHDVSDDDIKTALETSVEIAEKCILVEPRLFL
jgi:DNA polymerase III subunit alpha